MKLIQSEGGPLIGLRRDQLDLWGGVFGKKFISCHSPFANDYEAACNSEHVNTGLRGNTSEIKSSVGHGILINPPDRTAILSIDQDSIYIGQIEACEPGWSLASVKRDDFDTARFNPKHDVFFSCKSCTYILFDASYAGCDIGDDYLTFDLEGGEYIFSTAAYEPDEKTWLILYRIARVNTVL